MLGRRSFLFGFGAAAITAPAIIRPGVLMPIKKVLLPDDGIALLSSEHPINLGMTLVTSMIEPFSMVEVPHLAHLAMPEDLGVVSWPNGGFRVVRHGRES